MARGLPALAATAAASAAAPARTSATATTTAATGHLRTRFIHRNRPTVNLRTVECLDRRTRFGEDDVIAGEESARSRQPARVE